MCHDLSATGQTPQWAINSILAGQILLWESVSLVCCVVQKLSDLPGLQEDLSSRFCGEITASSVLLGLAGRSQEINGLTLSIWSYFFLFSLPNSIYRLSGGWILHSQVYWSLHQIPAEYWQCFRNWPDTGYLDGHIANIHEYSWKCYNSLISAVYTITSCL